MATMRSQQQPVRAELPMLETLALTSGGAVVMAASTVLWPRTRRGDDFGPGRPQVRPAGRRIRTAGPHIDASGWPGPAVGAPGSAVADDMAKVKKITGDRCTSLRVNRPPLSPAPLRFRRSGSERRKELRTLDGSNFVSRWAGEGLPLGAEGRRSWRRGHPICESPCSCRPVWEGGQYEGDDTTRFETLRLAMELGVDYVDIELKVADKFMSFISGHKPENCKLIVSSHNYEYTPSCEEITNLVARIQAVGADIVKVATTAKDIVDVSRMFQVMVHCQVPMIGLVMSEKGLMSRVLAPKFGGYLTFGILNATKTSASGQPTIEDLLGIYNIKCIGPDTKVLGLIANPVKQSKSPILHNKCLQYIGYNAVYLPLLGDNLASFLETYSSPDFSGFSCSLPFKVDAVQCCDEHDPVAKSIGAINTIVRRSDGKLVGYNTDYIGAISAIEDGIGGPGSKDAVISPLAGRLIVVVGAGGAGKAIAYGAKEKGARVVIANRTYEKAVSLANAIGGQALRLKDLETFRPEEGMILANATSLGMYPNVDGTPIPKKALGFYDVAFDAVYAPKVTRLLREAEECGVKVVSGVEMFIRQAMGQFEHFTGGIEAPESLMREIAAKYT